MVIKTGDKIPAPKFELIPEELRNFRHWLMWVAKTIKDKPGELTKVPATINGNSFYAWNNPKNLYGFDEVEKAFQTGKFDGVGFVLEGTDFICIDLDNNTSASNISDELLGLLKNGYTEFSPSGKGYHHWMKGRKPEGMGKNGYTKDGEKLEVFGGSGWVTVTGHVELLFSSNSQINKNQTLINRISNSYFKKNHSKELTIKGSIMEKNIPNLENIRNEIFNGPNGQKIRALWNGDTSMYRGDHSVADLALCRYLVDYLGDDYSIVDVFFRESGLYRTKWDEKRGNTTYGGLTITKAFESREKNKIEKYTKHIKDKNDRKLDEEQIIEGMSKGKAEGDQSEIKLMRRDVIRSNMDVIAALNEYAKKKEKYNCMFAERLDQQQELIENAIEQLLQLKNAFKETMELQKLICNRLETTNVEKKDFFARILRK